MSSGCGAIANSAGGRPSKIAIACSWSARWRRMSISWAIVESSSVSACSKSIRLTSPAPNCFCVRSICLRYDSKVLLENVVLGIERADVEIILGDVGFEGLQHDLKSADDACRWRPRLHKRCGRGPRCRPRR